MPAANANHVRYPNLYTWLVFVATMDALLTYIVLHVGGREANEIAASVFDTFGWHGMLYYKLALILLVIVICEVIGRQNDVWGRRLAKIGIALTCVPIVMAFVLLGGRAMGPR